MATKCLALLIALTFPVSLPAADVHWQKQSSATTVRLRGVSAVSARVAWASGQGGTYTRTTDGGRNWRSGIVPGAEALDFRDVDAFDANTAYLLAIGEGDKSRIYKTIDGGATWTMQFKNENPAAFFDAMAFWDRDHGIAMSDPVEGRFLIITTADGGRSWIPAPSRGMPPALEGEGGFAASGTCITVQGRNNVWFGTGGPNGARVFRSSDRGRTWAVSTTPLASGKAAGVFSLTFWNARNGIAVGGDYTKEDDAAGNVTTTHDGGRTWKTVESSRPAGYRSGVARVSGAARLRLIAVGPSGTDYSLDGGRSWNPIGGDGFHAVNFAGVSAAGWAVGENGRIARYAP
ncbi:MAG TPA: hypothetical protein VNO50_02645 [Pyrinomonadaceae bacterium]|nr:hypothetical protein [Pyrinomonadaceae bacterium]